MYLSLFFSILSEHAFFNDMRCVSEMHFDRSDVINCPRVASFRHVSQCSSGSRATFHTHRSARTSMDQHDPIAIKTFERETLIAKGDFEPLDGMQTCSFNFAKISKVKSSLRKQNQSCIKPVRSWDEKEEVHARSKVLRTLSAGCFRFSLFVKWK